MSKEENDISVEDAFDQLMADNGHSDNEPADSSTTPVAEDTSETADANTDTNANTTDAAVSDDAATQDSTESTPEQEVDWKNEATKWEQKFKSFEGRMQSELARRREEEDRRQQQYLEVLAKVNPNQQAVAQKTAEDNLSKFKQLREDFPDIAEAVEEYIRNEVVEAKKLVGQEISHRMEPVISNLSQTQMDSHMHYILSKHPDAMQIRSSEPFGKWVQSLPPYAQAGAVHVIKLGTAEEVVSLLDQYKSSINKNQTQNTVKPTDNTNNTNAVSPEMAAALRSGLAVKPGKSADPNTANSAPDKNDFDSAWDEAVKQFGIK